MFPDCRLPFATARSRPDDFYSIHSLGLLRCVSELSNRPRNWWLTRSRVVCNGPRALPLLLTSLIFLSSVGSADALYCEHTSCVAFSLTVCNAISRKSFLRYGRVCHRLSTGARIAVAVSVGEYSPLIDCFKWKLDRYDGFVR